MYNFTLHVPTVVHFGKGQVTHLTELTDYGKRVLLVYGGGSIKKAGIYDQVINVLDQAGLEVFELSGVEPNPHIQTVRRGNDLCHEHNIQMVLGVGGGSSMDCAKVVAAAACYDGDPWDLVVDSKKIKRALPIFCIPTLAATGSETDGWAVVSDLDKREKWDTGSEHMVPTMSILDPTYTFTVSRRQTAAGTADMISHVFESYFTLEPGTDVQRGICEALLKVMIKCGPYAMANPEDYEARASLMHAASTALCGIIGSGSEPEWSAHPIEHELSAAYDVIHGEGLAVVTPAWMEYVLSDKTVGCFVDLARNVWGLTGDDPMELAHAAIDATRTFFTEKLEQPTTLRELGIPDKTHFKEMASHAAPLCAEGFVPLGEKDVIAIYDACF